MTTINDLVQQRIAEARRRRARRRRQREELAASRARGLTARHAAKLERQDAHDTPPEAA